MSSGHNPEEKEKKKAMQGDYILRKSNKSKYNYNLADRISELADEVLVSILTLLPLNEAATTSILSKRWRYLCRYVLASTMTLNFDAEKTLCSLIDLNREEREQKISRYVDWVNSVVEQHTWPNIEQFRISFDLDNSFSSSINKWIQFALKKRVQILELDFSEDGIHHRQKSCYNFPHELLGINRGSTSTAVCCEIPSLNPCVYLGLKSIRVLHFNFVDVAEEVIECFLSNCPVLERLSVFHSPNLINLRVVGPSIALKYLVIRRCNSLESIEICDANLVSLSYVGNEISLLLRNVPLLVEVSISEDCICNNFIEVAFTQLSCCLSQLEILKLTDQIVPYKRDRIFPILANLKHLEIIFEEDNVCGLLQLTSFFRASPCLHRLVLYLQMDYTKSMRGKIKYKKAKCSHNYLKIVELVGYDGHTTDFELVKYLAKTAVKLEKIVIKGEEEEGPWRKMARDVAMHKLKEKVPSTIEFVQR
ncbi:F-box/LRR-repeat protein [Prunus yedoensis var. nudiflora]|uniref:F-box/LRR-repeat protein n=1 Tax=Prunus yedoensis var. nudiflora TaxID=2094558 RepID=A0A314YW16_PRUYE|nr:F-box/LRR-repeat protein [Prunus yedoensis var. nudiflora]